MKIHKDLIIATPSQVSSQIFFEGVIILRPWTF